MPSAAPPLLHPLEQAFEAWLAGQRRQERLRHASSAAVYRAMWQALVAWCLAQKPVLSLRTLDAAALDRYLASRDGMAGPGEPLTARYQWRLLSLVQRVQVDHALRSALPPQLAAQALIRQRPALRRANLPDDELLPAALQDDEAERLEARWTSLAGLADAGSASGSPQRWQSLRDEAAAGLQLGAGLGPGEVRALCLADVDLLGSRAPELPWRLQVPASGSAPAHRVPVSGWAARLLGCWLQRRHDEALPGPWLFPSTRSGKPWGKVAQFESVRRLFADAGIADSGGGSFKLRHSFALRQLRDGTSPDELARWLGVVDPGVMARYQRMIDGQGGTGAAHPVPAVRPDD